MIYSLYEEIVSPEFNFIHCVQLKKYIERLKLGIRLDEACTFHGMGRNSMHHSESTGLSLNRRQNSKQN